MIRAFLYLLVVAALAFAASWLADLPGSFELTVAGYQFETSLLVAFVLLLVVVALVMILWALIAWIFRSPQAVSGFFRARRRDKGYRALSRGMVAAAAGDVRLARHYSSEARRLAPRESLSLLLSAQAAQLSGDRAAARRSFEAMAGRPDTEILGLRGLYIEAQRDGDHEAARAYAERAARSAPSLPWAGNALLDYQTREHDWDEALSTVKRNADARLIDRKTAARQRAVLLTAKAQEIEETDTDGALALAIEAHKLAPSLVPAAVIAGRLSSATGNTRGATKILEKTWKEHPHPDIAEVYAHARPGDSARDRLKRVRALADKRPHEAEGAMAVAVAAIEARDWAVAREALAPLLRERPTRRTCMLMAEIEEGERGDAGRVREWLSRALRAPRDPAWVADGYVSEEWQPVSPVTGELDAFEWRTPPELIAEHEEEAPPPALEASVSEGKAGEGRPGDTVPPRPIPAAAPAAAKDDKSKKTTDRPASPAPEHPAKPAGETVESHSARTGAAADMPKAAESRTGKPDDRGLSGEKPEPGPPEPVRSEAKAGPPRPAPAGQAPAQPVTGGSKARKADAANAAAKAMPTATSAASPRGSAVTQAAKPTAPAAAPATAPKAAEQGSDDESLPRPPDDPGPEGTDDPDEPPRRVPVV